MEIKDALGMDWVSTRVDYPSGWLKTMEYLIVNATTFEFSDKPSI